MITALTADEMWAILTKTGPFQGERYIAGPWVPFPPPQFREAHASGVGYAVYRWNAHGDPIAKARCQSQVEEEDERLLDLGYELTDKGRQIPQSWWDEAAARAARA